MNYKLASLSLTRLTLLLGEVCDFVVLKTVVFNYQNRS
jgi:hypothetical protein